MVLPTASTSRRPSTAPSSLSSSSLQSRRQSSLPLLKLEPTRLAESVPPAASPRRWTRARRPSLPALSSPAQPASPNRPSMARLTAALPLPLGPLRAVIAQPETGTPLASLLHFGGFASTASPSPQSLFDPSADGFPFQPVEPVRLGRGESSIRVESPPPGCLKVDLVELSSSPSSGCLPWRRRTTVLSTRTPEGEIHLHSPMIRPGRMSHRMRPLEDALDEGVRVDPLVGQGTWEMDIASFERVCRAVGRSRSRKGPLLWLRLKEWASPWHMEVLRQLEKQGWERVYW